MKAAAVYRYETVITEDAGNKAGSERFNVTFGD